ncbi:MAG: hypothetical protein RSD41_05495 [Kiritimatiellia bacterium]
MKSIRYTLALLLMSLSGCAVFFGSRVDLVQWARNVQESTTFPVEHCRTLDLGNLHQSTLRLTFSDATHGVFDFGNDLRLRICDPCFLGGWATIRLKDLDGDATDDLLFQATLLPEGTPVTVAFLWRPHAWEQYTLPQ